MPSEIAGQDAPDMKKLQQALVDKLKHSGYITSSRVEAAFRAVPRHLFLPHLAPQEVYQDRAIMTKQVDGQYVSSSSQPAIMAIMLEQLDLRPGQRVLEIGAGTGYNAALMAHIVGESGHVVTLDIDDDLVEGARMHLASAGYERVQVVCADGGLGYPSAAPYDRIVLTVSSADITPAWREQLRQGGRFLLPLAVRGPQISVAFESLPDQGYWRSSSIRPCGFVGLRGAFVGESHEIQLTPEPGRVLLRLNEQTEIDPNAVLGLLQGPYHDMPTDVRVHVHDLFWDLNFWIAAHSPHVCTVIAYGEATQKHLLPGLLPLPANVTMQQSSATGLFANGSLALIHSTLAETQPENTRPASSQPSTSPLLALYVRSYGEDDRLAQQLVDSVRAWDSMGHQSEQKLQIRVYPCEHTTGEQRDMSLDADAHDILVERIWSRFVFHWSS